MKVETPQILWHSEKKNLSAALLSIDHHATTNMMATAGNASAIHLWADQTVFVCSLNRHEGPVNRLAFCGNYLASAGDTGHVIIFKAENWDAHLRESDVRFYSAGRAGEAVTDLCWSGDAQRLVVGTIDHCVAVVERDAADDSFRIVFRNSTWHSHFVQGVSFDPLNMYMATASSDRTVRVMQTKTSKKQFSCSKTSKVKTKFVDESSLKSFCRRLAWTPDGGYLIIPAASHEDSYATLLYARHRYDEPAKILGGLETPSICVRPNPVLFAVNNETKENSGGLPYRCVFAVLTWDKLIVYDTVSDHPIAIVCGIHHTHLVDASWTSDGHTLAVCSTDGFITIVRFDDGELGDVYERKVPNPPAPRSCAQNKVIQLPPVLPPCDPGAVTVQARPSKKIKTGDATTSEKRQLPGSTTANPKKKKRIQPTLVGGMGSL